MERDHNIINNQLCKLLKFKTIGGNNFNKGCFWTELRNQTQVLTCVRQSLP